MNISDIEAPWTDEITHRLAENYIITVKQVVRITQIDNGYKLLAKLTHSQEDQWKRWGNALESFITAESKQLANIHTNELLTEEMVTLKPHFNPKSSGEKDDNKNKND